MAHLATAGRPLGRPAGLLERLDPATRTAAGIGLLLAFLALYPTAMLFYGSVSDAPLGVAGHFTFQHSRTAYGDPETYAADHRRTGPDRGLHDEDRAGGAHGVSAQPQSIPTRETLGLLTDKHYAFLLDNDRVVRALRISVILASVGATAGMLLASAVAYLTARTKVPGRGLLEILTFIPWAFPGTALAIGLL